LVLARLYSNGSAAEKSNEIALLCLAGDMSLLFAKPSAQQIKKARSDCDQSSIWLSTTVWEAVGAPMNVSKRQLQRALPV